MAPWDADEGVEDVSKDTSPAMVVHPNCRIFDNKSVGHGNDSEKPSSTVKRRPRRESAVLVECDLPGTVLTTRVESSISATAHQPRHDATSPGPFWEMIFCGTVEVVPL